MRALLRVAVAAAAMCIAVACARPPDAPEGGTSTSLPTIQPLDVRGADACSIVAPASLSSVGLDPATRLDETNTLASACSWTSTDGDERAMLVINGSFDIGILRSAGADTVQEFDIAGRAAVREGEPQAAICTIYAEPAPDQTISAEFASSKTDQPAQSCPKAEQIVLDVLAALAAR